MKTLIINPPNKPFTNKNILIEPIDILMLKGFLKQNNINCGHIDMDQKKLYPKDLLKIFSTKQISHIIILFDYHIPLHKDSSLKYLFQICSLAEKYGIKTIVGGKIATFQAQQLIYEKSPINIAIAYDIENTLLDLIKLQDRTYTNLTKINNISFWNNKFIQTKTNKDTFDIDTINPIKHQKNRGYIDVKSILSSRGCIMKCKYCHVPNFWGKRKARNITKIFEEIKQISDSKISNKILLLDDNANVDNLRLRKLAQQMIKNKINCKLGLLGTIKGFELQTMKKLYEAGFRWIHYGAESGDEIISQQTNKNLTNKEILDTIKKTKNIGFRIRTSWILDLPNSTPQSIDKTINLILQTQTDEIRLHYMTLRYGTTYHQKLNKDFEAPNQYIHNNKIQLYNKNLNPKLLYSKINSMINILKKNGYIIIKDIKENEKLIKLAKKQNIKIVAFCPLRYGLNR